MHAIPLALILALSGCSFVMTRGPTEPMRQRVQPADCTTSRVAPVIDGYFTITTASMALLFLMMGVGSENDCKDAEPGKCSNTSGMAMVGVMSGAVAGVFAASAIRGVHNADACRALMQIPSPANN